MEDFDLYDDILGSKEEYKENYVSKDDVEKWKKEVETSRQRLATIMGVNKELKEKCDNLETNISTLLKTCRNEINRKNQVIAELRRDLDSIILKRILNSGSKTEINFVALLFQPLISSY